MAKPTTNRQSTRAESQKTQRRNNNQKGSTTPTVSHKKLADALSKEWGLAYYYRGVSDIVDQISMRKDRSPLVHHAISFDMLKKLTTLSSIGTKIKLGKTLASEDEMIASFIATQDVPVFGLSMAMKLKADLFHYFRDFDLEALAAYVEDLSRRRVVTPGSSYPQLPVPMNHDHRVTEYLYGILHGDLVFRPEYQVDYESINRGLASGKGIFVPKNFKVKRFITLPPRDITDKQYIIFEALRDFVSIKSKTSGHITQFDDQSVQHTFLKDENMCTIDLSSASDRVYTDLLKEVWPEFFEKFGKLLPNDILLPNGKVFDLTCVGTQGFPLTFALLSILVGRIVHIAKISTHASSNYGDDIICHKSDFRDVYVALEALGFKINKGKSFGPNSSFVESCGEDIFRKRYNLNGSQILVNQNITPIHLRGESHIEVINFMNQLCEKEMITTDAALRILRNFNVTFYSFSWPYAQTEFHFRFGSSVITNGFKPQYRHNRSLFVKQMKVPFMDSQPTQFKGLGKADSAILIDILELDSTLKDYRTFIPYVDRKVSDFPAPYKYLRLLDHKYYDVYKFLTNPDNSDNLEFYKEQGISMNVACAFRLCVGHLFQYRSGQQLEESKFTEDTIKNWSEMIDSILGIVDSGTLSVFKYGDKPSYKYIPVPE